MCFVIRSEWNIPGNKTKEDSMKQCGNNMQILSPLVPKFLSFIRFFPYLIGMISARQFVIFVFSSVTSVRLRQFEVARGLLFRFSAPRAVWPAFNMLTGPLARLSAGPVRKGGSRGMVCPSQAPTPLEREKQNGCGGCARSADTQSWHHSAL